MELVGVETRVRRVPSLAAAAPERVRTRLTGPVREVAVLHRGRDAVYLEESGWALGVVTGRASRVPCALALVAPDLDLSRVQHAEVGAGEVRLHSPGEVVTARVGRLVDATVPRLRALPGPHVRDRVLAVLRDHARPAYDELGPGLVAQVADHPSRLLGLGSGLTPLGDDVLAGWAATSYALGEPASTPDARAATTLLSATLLDCARRGEVLPEFRDLVLVLAGPDPDLLALERAATALAAVGHTSGAGLLLGALLRLEGIRR